MGQFCGSGAFGCLLIAVIILYVVSSAEGVLKCFVCNSGLAGHEDCADVGKLDDRKEDWLVECTKSSYKFILGHDTNTTGTDFLNKIPVKSWWNKTLTEKVQSQITSDDIAAANSALDARSNAIDEVMMTAGAMPEVFPGENEGMVCIKITVDIPYTRNKDDETLPTRIIRLCGFETREWRNGRKRKRGLKEDPKDEAVSEAADEAEGLCDTLTGVSAGTKINVCTCYPEDDADQGCNGIGPAKQPQKIFRVVLFSTSLLTYIYLKWGQ